MLVSVVLLISVLILIRQLSTIAMMWKVNGIEMIPHMIVLFILILFASCTKDELFYPICADGDCNAQFYIDYPQDENGYYHIDLDFSKEYLPNFDIEVDASVTHPRWWYNDSPVIVAVFETDTYWEYGYDLLPIVQSSKIYFNQYNSTRAYSKRIVGPFPREMKGDTITIYPTIMWDAGNSYKKETFSLKFIIE